MKRFIRGALAAVSLVAVLAGCASGGRGQGPLATYGFLASANPALPQNVMGIINEQREPKEIFVVVPPGTDLHALVATLSFGAEAGISVVSSGTRVAQQNGVTANDFSVPVTYSIDVPGEKKPWTYIVKVREAETNARLGSLVIPQGAALSPAFNPTVHSYILTVLYASTSVRVEARGQTSTLKSVTVDGAATRGPRVRPSSTSRTSRIARSSSKRLPRTGQRGTGTPSPFEGALRTITRSWAAWSCRTRRSPRRSPPGASTTRSWCPSRPRSLPCAPGRRAPWRH